MLILLRALSIAYAASGAHEPPKAAKERVTSLPCKYKLVMYVLPRLKIDRVCHKFSGGSLIGVQAFRGVLTLAGSLPVSLLQTSARSCSA